MGRASVGMAGRPSRDREARLGVLRTCYSISSVNGCESVI